MSEEINNNIQTILHSLQAKVDRLENVNKELEEKLLQQDKSIDQLLTNVNLQKSNSAPSTSRQEEEHLLLDKEDDVEQVSHSSKTSKDNKKKLTVDRSIHNLPLVNILGIIFPVLSAIAMLADSILHIIFHKSDDDKQKNYAGLICTVLILFYYLQYDVKFNLTHPRLYILYQFLIWSLVFTGDIIYVYYYHTMLHRPFMMYTFVCYAILDTGYIFTIGYLKIKGYRQHMFIITIQSIFELIAMMTEMLIIFIPIFGTHEAITTTSVTFFMLYKFLSASYTDMLDLKYSKLSRFCLWMLVLFSILSVVFEYFVYGFEQLIEENTKNHQNYQKNQTSTLSSSTNQYKNTENYFVIARELSEFIGTIACYSLLILQFFMKKERKNK
ncbi:unnamed protein product [Adineta steineri]|uniref:Uncharacterized protein n=2 Tax=Adineta steineri TaxID=433720 RepID=A0A814CHX0_9BILA|nr:unnamed protein product [Adineta steineri]CAF3648822.1 unnamed protein product [Adineta steineri]